MFNRFYLLSVTRVVALLVLRRRDDKGPPQIKQPIFPQTSSICSLFINLLGGVCFLFLWSVVTPAVRTLFGRKLACRSTHGQDHHADFVDQILPYVQTKPYGHGLFPSSRKTEHHNNSTFV